MAAISDACEQLAEALAAGWNGGLASPAACTALQRLLPGLQYLSIVLVCPGQPSCLVAAANCAVPRPLELHLHDAARSAAGQAVGHGKPLQASWSDGHAASAAAAAWSDVAQMLSEAGPGITCMLCLPFGSSRVQHSSGSSSTTAAGHSSCPQHGHVGNGGGGAGALLCGFAAAPHLGPRHKAALAALLRHLPAATAQMSEGTLDFVGYVCGMLGASCCCDHAPGTETEAPAEGCRPDSVSPGGAGNSGGGSPSRSSVPNSVLGCDEAWGERSRQPAEPSGAAVLRPALPLGQTSGRDGAPAATAAAEAACAFPALDGSRTPSPARRHGFSKALLAHVAAEPGALRCRSALCLHFSSPQVEQQYQAWLAPAQLWTDILSSLLIVAAMLIVALRPPFQLWHNAPGTLALGAGMLAPLAFTLLSGPRYAAWRDSFMALFRLYAIVFACTAGIPAIAVPLPPERVHHWGPFWRLSGAESLLASALGFLLRQSLHVPVQAAALAVALSSLPTMCAQSFPDGCRATCLTRGALAAVGLGCAVPALLLHVLEQRSRATFARLLRETAADC